MNSSHEQSTFIGKFTFVYKLLSLPLNEFLETKILHALYSAQKLGFGSCQLRHFDAMCTQNYK